MGLMKFRRRINSTKSLKNGGAIRRRTPNFQYSVVNPGLPDRVSRRI